MFKLIPAGQGMSMLQSDPMPTAEAEAKLADLNEDEGEGADEEMGGMRGEMMKRPMPAARGPVPEFGAMRGAGARPGGMAGQGPVPPFRG